MEIGPGSGLTRRGWSLLGAAIGLLVGSRLLGTVELAMLAIAALALLSLGWLWSSRRRMALAAGRRVRPQRTIVGEDARVDLVVTNQGRRATPAIAVADVFDVGRRAARFTLPPLPAAEEARAAYRVPTTRRGRYAIGPLVGMVTDPFGLSRRRFEVHGPDELLVWPRVHAITVPALGGGRASIRPGDAHALVGEGTEFLTLREYDQGDDLRQVHWRSTARTGQLMIRQHEAHRQARALVFLDVRPEQFDARSFERAVEAAASVVYRLERLRRHVELALSSGRVLRGGAEVMLDRLAVVEPHGPDRAAGILAHRRERSLTVIVTSGVDTEIGARAAALGAHGPTVVVTTRTPIEPIPGVRGVDASDRPFADAWNQAMASWSTAASQRLPARR